MEERINLHLEASSDVSPSNMPSDLINAEMGSMGGSGLSPETLGLESVEGYEYDFAIGQEISTGGDEVTLDLESETIDQEVADSNENLLNAWYGSYSDDPETREALEVVIGRDDRIRILSTTSYPWRAICSLRMRTKTGKNYIGTGWFVSPRTVITAGHCVYFHNEGGWASEIRVMPGRNGSSLPYGSCLASSFRSVTGWTRNKGRNYDYGAIILPSNCRLGARTGYFGYAYMGDNSLRNKYLNLSGYPGDKPSGTQWYHCRRVKSLTSRTIVYDIDTAGGQSGSPVWYIRDGQRYAVGIHTNGHTSGNSATRIVKPVFDNIKSWKALGM